MKTIKELRKDINFNVKSCASYLKYFIRYDFDFDVYLESKGINLQRDLVWNLFQKRELIKSILLDRYIPRLSIISLITDKYLIIDGKQRLSSIIEFINNEFTIILEDEEYFFNNLPDDYKLAIENFNIEYDIIYETYNHIITDDDKIEWFKFLNFAGTKQDEEHLNLLS